MSDTDTEAAGGVWDRPAHGGKHLYQAVQYQQGNKTASTSGQTAAERAPAQSRHSRLNAFVYQQSFPHSPRSASGRLQGQGCPQNHVSFLQPLPYPWTRSQHVPDKFALFIHRDLSALKLSPKISPWTLHTSLVIQHLNV